MRTAVIALLSVLAAGTVSARNITFDDLYSLSRCADPQISPDAARIVFVLRTSDPTENERQSHLWLMDADGSNPRQLTFGSSGESYPRWCHRSSIALGHWLHRQR